MKRIEDERIRFYLKHRQQIEEWAEVGKTDLPAFAREFYASLREDLIPQARTYRVDIESDVEIVEGEHFIGLRRRNWPETLAVELGWHNNDGLSNHQLWCGIHVEGGTESSYWDDLIQRRDRPEAASYSRRDSTYGYPMYKFIDRPYPNLWEGNNLDEYGNCLIKALLQAWCDLGPLVDKAL